LVPELVEGEQKEPLSVGPWACRRGTKRTTLSWSLSLSKGNKKNHSLPAFYWTCSIKLPGNLIILFSLRQAQGPEFLSCRVITQMKRP